MTRYMLPLGIVVAAVGQIVLARMNPNTPWARWTEALGGVLLLFGGVSFGIGALDRPRLDTWPRPTEHAEEQAASDLFPLWLPGLAGSIIAGALAVIIFAMAGESSAVVALWLLGMLLLLGSQLRGKPSWPRMPRSEWGYALALVVVLAIAVFSRAWHLSTLPLNLDGDFADFGNQARALATGEQTKIFTYGWAEIPMLGFAPAWLTMLVFGTGLVGLNASGVIEGALIVLGVYVLGRELFNPRVGLLAAAVMVVSYAHIAVSRQSAYVDPIFSMTWAIYLLLVGLRKGHGWALVLSGFLVAFSLQVYYSGRIVLPLLGVAFLYCLVAQRTWLLARWKGLLIFALAVLIGLGPILIIFGRSPAEMMSRTNAVVVFNPEVQKHLAGVYGVHTLDEILVQQAVRTLLAFNYYIDTGTQFALGHPFLDPFTGVLFALGFGYLLLYVQRPGSWLLLWWLLLGMVIGSVLTVNAPFWPRLLIMLPAVALACGLALSVTYDALVEALQHTRTPAVVVSAITALALLVVGVVNWNTYVKSKEAWASARTRIGLYMQAQPATARAYLVSDAYGYEDREFRFMIPGKLAGNLTADEAIAQIAPAGVPTLLIVTPDKPELIQILSTRYASETIGGNSPGEISAYVFKVY